MQKLRVILEGTDSTASRIFDLFIQFLIILSLVCFCIETMPNLDQSIPPVLRIIEVITIIVFTIEYILRVVVADNKIKFIFSFYGIIDLMAILPFFVSRTIDLRSLRAFRLFRLLRVLKVVRYNRALKTLGRAFQQIKEELVLFIFATLLLLFVSAVGIYYFENPAQPDVYQSVFHSLWWAVATLTTVGYGDIYPVTVGGKIFTFVMLLIGLGIVAVPTGLIASSLTKVMQEEKKRRKGGGSRSRRLKKKRMYR